MDIQCNCSLLKHNTFGFDVKARCVVEYSSVEELERIIRDGLTRDNVLHIGGGSNLLFTGDFDGVVLHSAIVDGRIISQDEDSVLVRVGAGFVWDDFVALCVKKGWSGVENLSLIPGEVGASAVQNIGAYGAEVKDVIHEVEVVDLQNGQTERLPVSHCGYAYRYSHFKGKWKGRYAVTYVTFRLSKHFEPNLSYAPLKNQMKNWENVKVTPDMIRDFVIETRRNKLPDPKVLGNAGSFFMNPIVSYDQLESLKKTFPDIPYYNMDDGAKVPAGWLIEQCGWKGKRFGAVGVYEKQALVLVNYGGGTGTEIVALSNRISKDVFHKFGVEIHSEVNWI